MVRLMFWVLTALAPLIALEASSPAQAEMVEVSPGVRVERQSYTVPANEAPFFNFISPTAEQKAANERFVQITLERVADRAKAADMAIAAGWRALIGQNDLVTAAKRFNQAYLLDPRRSGVFHGFGAIAANRFSNYQQADELLRLAATLDSPAKSLAADHGRVLLMAKRPADARTLLEKAVKDDPDWAIPQANLAWAMYLTGNAAEACRLALATTGRSLDSVAKDLTLLRERAACGA